jgi:hypothetical protein
LRISSPPRVLRCRDSLKANVEGRCHGGFVINVISNSFDAWLIDY